MKTYLHFNGIRDQLETWFTFYIPLSTFNLHNYKNET